MSHILLPATQAVPFYGLPEPTVEKHTQNRRAWVGLAGVACAGALVVATSVLSYDGASSTSGLLTTAARVNVATPSTQVKGNRVSQIVAPKAFAGARESSEIRTTGTQTTKAHANRAEESTLTSAPLEPVEAIQSGMDSASSKSSTSPFVMVAPLMGLMGLGLALQRWGKKDQAQDLESISVPKMAMAAVGEVGSTYEASLQKPLGIQFGRGSDSQVYIKSAPVGDPRYADFQPGDKVLQVSASFGPDVWEAMNYGQVMYAIRTRNGEVYLKMERRGGDLKIFELEAATDFAKERAGGNYGAGTREVQLQRFTDAKEVQRRREEMFRDGTGFVRQKQFEKAIPLFEEIIALEPKKFIGDRGERVTQVYKMTKYQLACAYSLTNAIQASVDALEGCLRAGYEDYDKIKSDPDLANLRKDSSFQALMDKYDESVLNMAAINSLKNMFGGMFGGKKE